MLDTVDHNDPAATGEIRWSKILTGKTVHSSPAIGPDGTIYIGSQDSEDSFLEAITPDGDICWGPLSLGPGTFGSTPALGADGAVYITSSRGLWAVNPDGTPRWCAPHPNGVMLTSSPALGAEGRVNVLGFGVGTVLLAFDLEGQVLWTTQPLEGSRFSPTMSKPAAGRDGTVYLSSVGSRLDGFIPTIDLIAVNSDGIVRWVAPIGDGRPPWTSPHIGASTPILGVDGTIYLTSFDYDRGTAYLDAFEPDGSPRWPSGTRLTGYIGGMVPAALPDGHVVVGTYGRGPALDAIAPNGTHLWSTAHLGGVNVRWPAVGPDGVIYLGTFDGRGRAYLDAIRPDGTSHWESVGLKGGTIHSTPAIGADGTVYIGSHDEHHGYLNAVGS